MNRISCRVAAFWDEEAEVWTASSEDVPGLATEADTLDALTQKLRILIPELLQLNQVIPQHEVSAVAIDLTSHKQELVMVTV